VRDFGGPMLVHVIICPGLAWPDRVAEMQAFVFELISKMKFEAVEKTSLVRRENCNQLPLRISIINHSE